MTDQIKIAGAPISWGVCEVPNWGHQLTPQRVLTEMAELGFTATEFGPEGFLPTDPAEKASFLSQYGLRAIGGFFPVLLHEKGHDPLLAVANELENYGPAGAEVLVLAAYTGSDGYDSRPTLDQDGWHTMFENLKRISEYAASKGVLAVLHPHVGTMVETKADVEKVLAGSDIPFCLDTGHMWIGGTDPVEFVSKYANRVKHSHLKDVNLEIAQKVRDGLGYVEAVKQGLYTPLGQGDVNVRSIIEDLVRSGYEGWFALEQDLVLSKEPKTGEGPIEHARQSVKFLKEVIEGLN